MTIQRQDRSGDEVGPGGDIKLLMGPDLKVTGTVGCRRMSCPAREVRVPAAKPGAPFGEEEEEEEAFWTVPCFMFLFFLFSMTSAKVSSDCFSRKCCSGCNVVKLISLSLFQPS